MTEQKGFLIYRDIEDTLNEMTDEEAGQLLKGMVRYFNHGEDPHFSGSLKFAFIPIRQQIDRDSEKYADKCAKNKKSIQDYWDKVKEDTNEYERIRTNTNATNKNTKTNTNTNTKTKTNTKTTTNTNTNTNTTSVVVASGDDDILFNLWKRLTPQDVDRIYDAYPNSGGDLIQTVYEDVRDKRKEIKRPVSYILGYAKRIGWDDDAEHMEVN